MLFHSVRKFINQTKFDWLIMIIVFILYEINNNIIIEYLSGSLKNFFISYFDDMICTTFFIAYINFFLTIKNKKIVKLKYIVIICIILGFFWEYITPIYKPDTTTDILDLVFYIIGGIFYWKMLQVHNKKIYLKGELKNEIYK